VTEEVGGEMSPPPQCRSPLGNLGGQSYTECHPLLGKSNVGGGICMIHCDGAVGLAEGMGDVLSTLDFTRSNCTKQSRTWSTYKVLHVLESPLVACITPENPEIDFAIAPRMILGRLTTCSVLNTSRSKFGTNVPVERPSVWIS